MPHTFSWEPHVATVRFEGFVSGEEFLAGARALGADPRFDDPRYVVNDFTAITGHAIDAPELMEDLGAISIGSRATNPQLRVLIVTTDERIRRLAAGMSSPPYDDSHAKHVFEAPADLHGWLRGALLQRDPAFRGS